jgi:hypothetical protein
MCIFSLCADVRMSKLAFQSVLEFIKADIGPIWGQPIQTTNFSKRASTCHTALLATDKIVIDDAHTFDALLCGHKGACSILMSIYEGFKLAVRLSLFTVCILVRKLWIYFCLIVCGESFKQSFCSPSNARIY